MENKTFQKLARAISSIICRRHARQHTYVTTRKISFQAPETVHTRKIWIICTLPPVKQLHSGKIRARFISQIENIASLRG